MVKKRDGTVVPFDRSRIKEAVAAAMKASGEGDEEQAEKVTEAVLEKCVAEESVESLQQKVLQVLVELGLKAVYAAYKAYMEKRAKARETKNKVLEGITKLEH